MTSVAYFADCHDVATIKRLYKQLAMRWHPDRPDGDTAIMQKINAQYKTALSAKHGSQATDEQGHTHTYYYREATEQAIMDKVAEVIKSGILSNDVELWLVGTWLWVKGDTKPHRQTLGREGLCFTWNRSRQCWQWHLPTKYRTTASPHSFEAIATKYGASRIVQPEDAIV